MKFTITGLQQRARTVGVYTFALCAGLLAAWAVHDHIQTREREIERQSEVAVLTRVVAAVDIEAGTRLDTDHLAVRDIPVPWVPGGSFDPGAVERAIGGILTSDLRRGDILLDAHVTSDTGPPISELVSSGRRAVTLPATEINAVSGLLQVDDLIDLYVSFTHQGQHLTAPLLQGVRVLALGGTAEAPVSITFDTSEQNAIKLVAARQSGTLTAMVRHRGDVVISRESEPGDLAALMGIDQREVASHAPIPILYGDRVDTAFIPDGLPGDLPPSVPRASTLQDAP